MNQVDVLTVLEECGAYVDDAAQFPEQFKAGVVKRHQRDYAQSRVAVAWLIASATEAAKQLRANGCDGHAAHLTAAITRCGVDA